MKPLRLVKSIRSSFSSVLESQQLLFTIHLFELRPSHGIKTPSIDGTIIGHNIYDDEQANRMVPS